jgi:hypothetical protein
MSCQIRHAADCIALDFDIGTQHLTYERLQPAKFDDEKLIVSYRDISISKVLVGIMASLLFTARFPRAALAARWTSAS